MKIKTRPATLDRVLARQIQPHRPPLRPFWPLWAIVRIWSAIDLWRLKFRYMEKDMDRLGGGPDLILMNHLVF